MFTKLKELIYGTVPTEPDTIPGVHPFPDLVETDTPIYAALAAEAGRDE